jgi:hypothetical protein
MNPPVGPQSERRLFRRRTPKASVRITCQLGSLGLGPNVAVSILDLSEAGTRFVAKGALPPGQEVEINLSEPSLGRPVKRLAVVVWCADQGQGTWWAVAKFDRRLDYAELHRLV